MALPSIVRCSNLDAFVSAGLLSSTSGRFCQSDDEARGCATIAGFESIVDEGSCRDALYTVYGLTGLGTTLTGKRVPEFVVVSGVDAPSGCSTYYDPIEWAATQGSDQDDVLKTVYFNMDTSASTFKRGYFALCVGSRSPTPLAAMAVGQSG